MTDSLPPTAEVQHRQASAWRNLSAVWLVPVLALVVALGIAWQAYSSRGTLIEIRFENAAGVTAGETTVRYRDVVIGTVQAVRFSPDLQTVIVETRLDSDVLPFLDEDAEFWVVRPEITSQGVTGLSTVVSGVYIEGAWNSEPGTAQRSFQGRQKPLFVRPGDQGRRITLRILSHAQLEAGAPVFYRGIRVGRLEQPTLTDDDSAIVVDAFIESPHDARLTTATRFWDSSGFSVSFGASGLTLDVESLASLVAGGVEFNNVLSDGQPIPDDFVFDIFDSEEDARASAFAVSSIGEIPVSVEFNEFVRGLAIGTRVELSGLQVGEVTAVRVKASDQADGPRRRLVIDMTLDPSRMGFPPNTGRQQVYDFLDGAIAEGLRARLATSSLITSAVKIELATLANADPAVFARDTTPYPTIPSVRVALPDFSATADGILRRVSALPFEELLTRAIATLASIEDLAANPDLRAAPSLAVSLLNDAQDIVSADSAQALPDEALAALADLRAILTSLRESGTVDALTAAAQQADSAMGAVAVATDQLPDVMANLRKLSETAAALEIEALVTSANSLLATANSFIGSEGMADVPAALAETMVELRKLAADLSEADVAGSLNATLSATREAAEGLPALVTQTQEVLARANALVGTYGSRSEFMTETMDVLREISVAARAISQLARTIERNPSSLIRGR